MTTTAQRIHDAKLAYLAAKAEIEDSLDDVWANLDRITTDDYDNSLEIYFEDCVVDLEPTEEQMAQIWDWGFDKCWLNFKGGNRSGGGTERYYSSPALLLRIERAKVHEPKTAVA